MSFFIRWGPAGGLMRMSLTLSKPSCVSDFPSPLKWLGQLCVCEVVPSYYSTQHSHLADFTIESSASAKGP